MTFNPFIGMFNERKYLLFKAERNPKLPVQFKDKGGMQVTRIFISSSGLSLTII